ncbi:ribosome silencing factor [Sesbania bispinosa]|nr:ribosome silencing factor [Sesbania bispinosa]
MRSSLFRVASHDEPLRQITPSPCSHRRRLRVVTLNARDLCLCGGGDDPKAETMFAMRPESCTRSRQPRQSERLDSALWLEGCGGPGRPHL